MSESINTQTASDTTPPSAGTNADVSAKVAELERINEGILRDLRKERDKRQELEARLVTPLAAPSPATQPDVNNAELANVLEPVIAPLRNEIFADRARQFLASKTGKSWADLEADTDFQTKLNAAVKKYGITGNYHETAVKAYEAMKRDEELETYRAREAEAARAASGASTTSMPTGAAPVKAGATEYDMDTWKRLPVAEYDRLFASGSVRKVGDKIVVTPR